MPKRKSAKRARQRGKAQTRHAMSAQRQATDTHYACGHVKPPKPNERVLEQRRALAGDADISTATIPLDLAFARGWIGEHHHRMGMRLKGLYSAAGLRGPRTTASAGAEVETANDDQPFDLRAKSVWATMPDREIEATWDSALNKCDDRVMALPTLDPAAYDQLATMGDEAARTALTNWRKAMDAMGAEEREEVFRVCIMDSFPWWITSRAAGRFQTAHERKRDLLMSGLERAASALRKPVQAHPAPKRWVDPGPKPRGPKLVSERIRCVDAAGELVREVVKVARR